MPKQRFWGFRVPFFILFLSLHLDLEPAKPDPLYAGRLLTHKRPLRYSWSCAVNRSTAQPPAYPPDTTQATTTVPPTRPHEIAVAPAPNSTSISASPLSQSPPPPSSRVKESHWRRVQVQQTAPEPPAGAVRGRRGEPIRHHSPPPPTSTGRYSTESTRAGTQAPCPHPSPGPSPYSCSSCCWGPNHTPHKT